MLRTGMSALRGGADFDYALRGVADDSGIALLLHVKHSRRAVSGQHR